MRDPEPENITGEKRHSFSWNVKVDVGHLVLGLALLVLLLKVAPLLVSGDEDEDEETSSFT